MCKCRFTSKEVLEEINKARTACGLVAMPYQTFIAHYRKINTLISPDERIGRSFIFRKGKMKKIVSILWDQSYRSIPRIDYTVWGPRGSWRKTG